MSFTTYGTAIAGSVLTAAFWNEQVRDNGNVLKTSITDDGYLHFLPTVYGGNHTLGDGDDVAIFSADATATLPPTPEDGKVYFIKCGGPSVDVTVDGNGNTIDGASTFDLGPYDAATFIWSDDAGEWGVF